MDFMLSQFSILFIDVTCPVCGRYLLERCTIR